MARVASLAALLFGCALSAGQAQAQAYLEKNLLAIYFGDKLVGSVVFDFETSGDDLVAHSRVVIKEKDGETVIYARREQRREVWRDGTLIAFSNDIEENGARWQVSAVPIGDKLAVTGPAGTTFLVREAVPATHWSVDLNRRQAIFDVRTGQRYYAETIGLPGVAMTVDGKKQTVRQYLMTGDINRNLFYRDDGRWLGMHYLGEDARMVRYRAE